MSREINPQRAEDYIKIQYWKCNVIGHRHRSQNAAAQCILRRKGEAGELKKLTRNLSMLTKLRNGVSLVEISRQHFCSDSNVTNAVNSSLKKAFMAARETGGCPYPLRSWKRLDYTNPEMKNELDFYETILIEMAVKLKELV